MWRNRRHRYAASSVTKETTEPGRSYLLIVPDEGARPFEEKEAVLQAATEAVERRTKAGSSTIDLTGIVVVEKTEQGVRAIAMALEDPVGTWSLCSLGGLSGMGAPKNKPPK